LGFIRFLADVTKKIAGEFSRVVKIKLKYLDIRVSSDEADKTALLYGTVSGAVAILIDIFKNFLKFDYDPEKVVVRSDFTQSEMKLKTKVIFKARLIQGIIAIINVIKLLTEKGKVK